MTGKGVIVKTSSGTSVPDDRSWPILLKKSAMVWASEKYASEIEIFTFGRGFRTRISRSSVQKRRFHQSMIRQFGQTDFFNRIGRVQSLRRHQHRERHLMNSSLRSIASRASRTFSATSADPRCSTQSESSRIAASRASWFSLILKSREGSRSELGLAVPRV